MSAPVPLKRKMGDEISPDAAMGTDGIDTDVVMDDEDRNSSAAETDDTTTTEKNEKIVDDFFEALELGDDSEKVKKIFLQAYDVCLNYDEEKTASSMRFAVASSMSVLGVDNKFVNRCLPLVAQLLRQPLPPHEEKAAKEEARAETTSSMAMPDLLVPTQNYRPRDMLLGRLRKLEESWDELAPFLAIVQSSGYGKTRTLLDVARERRVVYLLCSNIRGGLQAPAVASDFLKRIREKTSTEFREKEACKYLQAVVGSAAAYQTAEQLFDAQFTLNGGLKNDFYGVLADAYKKSQTPQSSPVNRPDQGSYFLDSDSSSAMSPTQKDHLVVVFDEGSLFD